MRAYNVPGLRARSLDGLDDLASHNVGIRRGTGAGQEQRAFFFGLRAVGGVAGRLLQGFESDLEPLSPNSAGLDDNDLDAEGLEFHSQAIAEAFEGEFDRVVPGPERLPHDLAANRRHVQDLSRPLLPHERRYKLDESGKAEEIDLELAARFVEGNVFHRFVRALAGVVDEDIDTALFSADRFGRPDDGTVIGEVERQQGCPQLLEICHAVQTPRRRVGCAALLNESLYRCLSYPSR
jgi:hypothetical protein